MSWGSRADLLDKAAMTAWLSDWNSMQARFQCLPQIAAATTTGNSSLVAMLTGFQDDGQQSWNQEWELQAIAPQPHDSVAYVMNRCDVGMLGNSHYLDPYI